MLIKEIHIDGFGIFSGKRVTGLTSGLNVIYGPNEFGKTTLLEFIRRIMFGFPTRKSRVNFYQPVGGSKLGGALKCELDSGQVISIIREEGPNGGPVIVRTDSTEHRGQSSLDSFLGHASRDIFQNIYAFTIDELQDVQSLRGDDIKSRIYGAGMGLGEVSLGDVESWLRKRCGEIFKPKGVARMGVILNEIKEIEVEIRDIQENIGKYDELKRAAARLDEEKNVLRKAIGDVELSRRVLETRQELYPVVIGILSASKELARLKDIPDFPENGLQELTAFKSEIENLLKRIQEEERAHDELKINLRNMVVNLELLSHEGDILFLQQSLKEVQSAIRDQVKVRNEWENVNEQIQVEIGTIGKDWTEQKVIDFELTEIEKSQIREFYEMHSEARQNVASARDKLDLHREQKVAAQPPPLSRLSPWLRYLPHGLGGVGVVGMGVGGLLSDMILFCIFLVMTVLGAFLYRKFKADLQPVEEPEDKLELSLATRVEEAERKQDQTFENWRAWLNGKGLDESLAPLVTEKIGDKIREIKNMMGQKDYLDERLGNMRETVEGVSRLIEKIGPSVENFLINKDIPTNIQVIGRYFDEARQGREKKELLETRCREQVQKIDGLKEKLNIKKARLSAFFKSADAVDEKDFMEKHNILERRETLRRTIEEKQGYVQSRIGLGEAYDGFVETVQSTSQEEIQQNLDEVSEKLNELNKDKDRLLQAIGETRTRIDQLSDNDDLLEKQSRLEIGRQRLKECAREWAVNRVALAMLNRARKKYEKERQPGVIKAAERMFTAITKGAYTRIFKPMDSDDILIDDGSDQSKGLLELSRGTREQLYLAMRFGLIEEYESRSEPLPVIMDDVFVNFDDDRNDRVIELVQRFAKPRQVVVLTCHQRTLDAYSARGATSITVK
ncbi:hypothetical protein UZ36_03045 [Candidatus Nitromaritima sp. SCGC AAA799-C22]|nr:hypothetical protein UZ36_03045 [Candidatus Nitromaritima sp. SCGC AAA799-C22]